VLLGLAVRGPVMAGGFAADDYGQIAMADGTFPVSRDAWSRFTFVSGDGQEAQRMREHGFLPWWSGDGLRLSVLRPLPSLLIGADRALFGNEPLPYHLHSLLWWLCLCAAVAALLHALLPASAARLALLIYVLDESHTLPLGWLANRNSVLASLFAVLALRRYLAMQRTGSLRDGLLCAALYSMSCLSGEYALAFLGYFAALSLLGPAAAPAQRLRTLWPVALPAALFLVARTAVGGGTRGSESAIEPFDRPIEFLAALPERAGVLWTEAMFAVRTDAWGDVSAVAQGLLGGEGALSPPALRALMVTTGVAGLALLLLCARTWRRPDTSTSGRGAGLGRVMAIGALWSTIPMCATLPAGRNLLAAQLGIAIVVATLLAEAWRRTAAWRSQRPPALLLAAAALLFATQLIAAPLSAWGRSVELRNYGQDTHRAVLALGGLGAGSPAQRVYVLQASDPTLMLYPALIRRQYGRVHPRAIYTLNGSRQPIVVRRTDASTLLLSHPQGEPMLSDPFELVFRRADALLRPGTLARLPGLRVEALEVSEGRPTVVRFRFDHDLDDPDVVLLRQHGIDLVRVVPPAIGHYVRVQH